jgi:large subunit ribosomal protein L15
MQLHDLQPKTKRRAAKRIGRGGKRGKTSGKGHKGQKARAGNSMRPEMREIIKKLPKLRGHGKNRARTVNAERPTAIPVNVAALEGAFEAGSSVTPKTLAAAGLIRVRNAGVPLVKILGTGDLSKKLDVSSCAVSASARAKIEKAGGSVS